MSFLTILVFLFPRIICLFKLRASILDISTYTGLLFCRVFKCFHLFSCRATYIPSIIVFILLFSIQKLAVRTAMLISPLNYWVFLFSLHCFELAGYTVIAIASVEPVPIQMVSMRTMNSLSHAANVFSSSRATLFYTRYATPALSCVLVWLQALIYIRSMPLFRCSVAPKVSSLCMVVPPMIGTSLHGFYANNCCLLIRVFTMQ